MRLTFTKGAGKADGLLVEREGRTAERIECPKQGIIPHDMVHYGVESVVGHGFLGLLAAGAPVSFTTAGGAEEEAAERLVECFQAELWGGRVPAAELITAYEHACAARGHAAVPVSPPRSMRSAPGSTS
ncbi:hypothetical protein [Sphingomonas glaciei]|uniref:Uncharacterized protein n=1 Tax=Sphingomonas glaciei TaxID=2938948 RepID=A0ABY5MZ50_9SPHN|nr:hypothetical protein [Sphingomonas glaciei]UUR07636.1 hypothetical protein M1K48_11965 [Sphingomonas glaciei]